MQTLSDVAASHEAMARRITQMLVDADALPLPGEYPMEYTDSHDLDVDYLLRLSAAYQRQDIDAIESEVGFKGRAERDEWKAQAIELMEGKGPRAKSDQARAES